MIKYNEAEKITILLEKYEDLKQKQDKLYELIDMFYYNMKDYKISKFEAQCVLEELYYATNNQIYLGGRPCIEIVE